MCRLQRFLFVRFFVTVLFLLPCGLWSAESQKLVIGVCSDTKSVVDVNGGLNLNALFLTRLQETLSIDYTVYSDTYENCLSRFDKGIYDIVLGVTKNTDVQRAHHFLTPMYAVHYNTIVAKLDNLALIKGDVQALDSLEIGIVKSVFSDEKRLIDFENTFHISLKRRYYDTEAELTSDFEDNIIPLKLTYNNELAETEKILWNLGYTPYYILCSEENSQLRKQFENAVDFIFRDNMFELTQMQMSVSDFELLSAPNILPQDIDYLKELPPIYVENLSKWHYLFDYLTKLSGLQFHDLANMEENRDKKIIMQIKPKSALARFVNGYQISNPVMWHSFWLIPAADEDVSEFLYNSTLSAFSKKICFPRGMEDVVSFFGTRINPFTAVYYDTYGDCLEAVSKHLNDACIIPSILFGTSYNLTEYPELKDVRFYELYVPYHLVIANPDYKRFVQVLNKFISGFPPGYLSMMERQDASKLFPYVASRAVKRRQSITLSLFVIVIFAFCYFIYLLKRNQLFRHWAYIDDLTGMWNFRHFHEEAEKMMRQHPDWNFAVIDSDIRGFKYINAIYGPAEGDRILQFYASCLLKYRFENMIVAHGYADRFLMLFPIESMDDCSQKCMDLFFRCNTDAAVQGFHCVIKDGVAVAGHDFGTQSIQNLIGRAGYAKAKIKHDLVNSISFFDEAMEKKSLFDQEIERYITQAFENEELYVVYQPKVDLLSGCIAGAEALVRWNSPELGLLMPDTFMPVLEKDGYIIKLDFYVYRKVFEFIEHMLSSGKKMVPISVNMSRFHLNVPNFIDKFTSLFSCYHIPANLIEIEVIERATGQNDTLIINVTKQLQRAGFHVAMDDFGTAESSLNMLHTIPVDILKLDKNFLYRSENTDDSRIIITKVIEMAQELGKKTVCEGVETQQQVEFLKSIGCNQAQGFYYYQPLGVNDFASLLISEQ
ncbi:MAG: bifunctional diguanylate cyclase/phosphodiesterase [Treponema sp.]|nr:bifunctional diguanylate cyclase/phosphodiesterase [Treponema sp.]